MAFYDWTFLVFIGKKCDFSLFSRCIKHSQYAHQIEGNGILISLNTKSRTPNEICKTIMVSYGILISQISTCYKYFCEIIAIQPNICVFIRKSCSWLINWSTIGSKLHISVIWASSQISSLQIRWFNSQNFTLLYFWIGLL